MEKRCIIITSYMESTIKKNVDIKPDDYIICADGGFKYAYENKVIPDAVIGDFDSYSLVAVEKLITRDSAYAKTEIIREAPEKDDTDTLMCVIHGLHMGFHEFIIVGGLGGRFDHTVANIQTLSYLVDAGGSGWIIDGSNKVTMIKGPSEITIDKDDSSYFSLYSFTEKCSGVSGDNMKYPMENDELMQSYPIGTSNEFTDDSANIKVEKGKLLIVKS